MARISRALTLSLHPNNPPADLRQCECVVILCGDVVERNASDLIIVWIIRILFSSDREALDQQNVPEKKLSVSLYSQALISLSPLSKPPRAWSQAGSRHSRDEAGMPYR